MMGKQLTKSVRLAGAQQLGLPVWAAVKMKSWQTNWPNMGKYWSKLLGSSWSVWNVLLTSLTLGSLLLVLHWIDPGAGFCHGLSWLLPLPPWLPPPPSWLRSSSSSSTAFLTFKRVSLVLKMSLSQAGIRRLNGLLVVPRSGFCRLLQRPSKGANILEISEALQGLIISLHTSVVANCLLVRT